LTQLGVLEILLKFEEEVKSFLDEFIVNRKRTTNTSDALFFETSSLIQPIFVAGGGK